MKTLFLAVATIVVASVGVMICLRLGEAKQVMAHADALILQEQKEFHDTAQNVNAILLQGGLAAYQAQMAAREQRAYWNTLGKQSEQFLLGLQYNINDPKDGFLPNSRHAIMALTLDAHDELTAMQGATEAVHSATDSLTLDFDSLHARIDDPRIDEILGNLQSTSFEIAGTTADVHTEIHKFVFPPPRKWYEKYILDPLKFGAKMLTVPLR